MKKKGFYLPSILYHGTNSSFDYFDLSFKGTNTGYPNTIHGFFFTEKPEHASLFGDRIIAAALIIDNPLNLTIPGIFTIKNQAPVLWEILTGEKITPWRALAKLDEHIGLGEIAELFSILTPEKPLI